MGAAAAGATIATMRHSTLLAAITAVLSLSLSGCIAEGEARRIETMTTQSSSALSSTATSPTKTAARASRSAVSKPAPRPPAPPAPPPTPPTELTVPILVYHHIRPTKGYSKETWSYKMSVSPTVFETQMQWLLDQGYTTISLTTLAEMRAGTRLGPTKPVVITFDDNQMSAYDLALPVLVKNNQMAVFYLITNRLDNSDSIGAAQIPALMAAGMEIGSHTVTHADLVRVSDTQLATEMADSRTALEALTGSPVLHLAYPLTSQNERVRTAAQAAGYTTATVMDPRSSTMKDSPWKLPRIMMTDDTNLARILP